MNIAALLVLGQVHAAAPDPCRFTNECMEEGECVGVGGECLAARTADCEQSKVCQEKGQCTFFDGECVAGTEGDCRASSACLKHGRRCHFDAAERRCDEGMERASPPLMIGGIVAIGVGGAAIITGGVFTVLEIVGCLGSTTLEPCRPDLGPIIIGSGAGLALLVGTPMAIAGGRSVPREKSAARPTVTVTPAGAALRWCF